MSFSISVPEKATCFFGVVFDECPHFVLSKTSECLVIVDNSKLMIISYNKEKDETNAIYSESPSLIAIIHRHTRLEMEEMAEKIE